MASNLFRATAIIGYRIISVCLIPTVKPFPPSIFIDFSGTTAWADFCTFSHTLRYGLLRNKIIVLHSVPCRPPQLRCAVFPSIYLPHLLSISSDSYWASVCLATLPDIPSLICDFCSSDQRFAIRLPSDSTSRWTPLPLAVSFPLSGHFTDFHRLDYAHAGRTKNGASSPKIFAYKFSLRITLDKGSLNNISYMICTINNLVIRG